VGQQLCDAAMAWTAMRVGTSLSQANWFHVGPLAGSCEATQHGGCFAAAAAAEVERQTSTVSR